MSTAVESPIDQIRQCQHADAAAVDEAFEILVLTLANGNHVDPSEANRILTAAGRTVDDLDTAVSNHGRRAEHVAMIARESELREMENEEVRLLRLAEEATEARRRAEEAEQAANDAMLTHANKKARLAQLIGEAKHALRSNPDLMPPSLAKRHRELQEQLDQLGYGQQCDAEREAIGVELSTIGRQSLDAAMRLVTDDDTPS